MSKGEDRTQNKIMVNADSMEQDSWYSLRMGSDFMFFASNVFTEVDTKDKILICIYFGLYIAAWIILHGLPNIRGTISM